LQANQKIEQLEMLQTENEKEEEVEKSLSFWQQLFRK
jgi:hypothetical protein